MAIKPVSLPAGAGLDYGKGDVRHFSPGDAVDVPGLANPTRYLAQRDNELADKVNEVIGVVNNQEQFVPLPMVRTIVPPNEEVIVTNYRIPPGFESRVLDAAISATPSSTNITLNVYYSQGFGNNTGLNVITTANEFTGGVKFYQTGEFIVTLKNTGPISLELSASVMLTVRPVGAQGTLLVGTIIEGPKGNPGMTGPPGPAGPPGTGGAGTPGMVWQGAWTNGNPYNPNDVVSYSLFGSITSSFICRVSNTAQIGVNDPQTDDTVVWNTVAMGGATGVGQQGPPGAILNAPVIDFNPLNGTLITGADFVAGNDTNDGYIGTSTYSASGTFPTLSLTEFSISSGTTAGNTLAMLFGSPKLYFKGHGTIRLPNTNDGAAFNYSNALIQVTVEDNGTSISNVSVGAQTIISSGTGSPVVSFGTFQTTAATVTNTHAVSTYKVSLPQSDVVITVVDPNPVKVQISVFGAQNG